MAKTNTDTRGSKKALVSKAAPTQAAPAGGTPPDIVSASPPSVIATETFIWPSVPDNTSYAGRNYMDMALRSEKFVPQISVDRNGNVITPQNAPAGIFAASVQNKTSTPVVTANPITRSSTTVAPIGPSGTAAGSSHAATGMGSGKPALAGNLNPIIEPPGFQAIFNTPTNNQIIQA